MLVGDLLHDARQVALSLRLGDAVGETTEVQQIGTGATVGGLFELQRLPNLLVEREQEALGHHADHDSLGAVDAQCLANHGRVGTQSLRPKLVTNEHHGRRSGHLVVGGEGAPDCRLHIEKLEQVGGHVGRGNELRIVAGRADVGVARPPGGDSVERALPFDDV